MYCTDCGKELADGTRYCPSCGTSVHMPTISEQREEGLPVPPLVWSEPASNDSVTPVMSSHPQSRGRKPVATVLLCFMWLLLTVVFEVVGYLVAELLHADSETGALVGGAVGAIVGIVAMGGRKLVVPSKESLAYAIRQGWWVIAVTVGLLAFDVVSSFVFAEDPVAIPADVVMRAIGLFVLCAAIGVSEEAMFRGLLLGGFLDAMGKNRRGLFGAVLLSSVIFGAAHIEWWAMDYMDPLSLLQALLKILQTGTYGFFLAALIVKSKNITGAAFLHGLDDYLLMFTTVVLMGESTDVEYVSTGEDAWAIIVLYAILIALYIPLVVKGVRMLREVPVPERGAFHKQ